MKIIDRIPSTKHGHPTRVCDLCSTTEVQPIPNPKGRATHYLIPMFSAVNEEDRVEYVLCANCADKEARTT